MHADRFAAPRRGVSSGGTRLAVAVITLGVVIRLSQMAFGRSLWVDEAMLALSVGSRGFGELAQPLLFDQMAPLGFLWAVKAVSLIAGMREWVLRLVPMLAGLATLPAIWLVARRFAAEPAAIAALLLSSLSSALIYFSNEFKPYAVDVLLTTLILGASYHLLKAPEHRTRWAVLAVLGAVGVWFSAPSVFVLAGCGAVIGVETIMQRRRTHFPALALLAASWFVSFAVAYAVVYGVAVNGHYMQTFWEGSYLRDGNAWELFRRSVWGILAGSLPSDRPWLVGRQLGSVMLNGLAVATLIASVAGFASLWRWRRRAAALVAAPIIVTAAASSFGVYPVASRLVVFLAPPLFILVGQGLYSLASLVARGRMLIPVIGAIVFSALGIPAHLRWHYGPVQWADSRYLVRSALEVADGGVYVFSKGIPIFLYYAMDWTKPDIDWLIASHELIGPGGFAFENQPGPLSFSAAQVDSLTWVAKGRELFGLPDGMAFRYMPAWNKDVPDRTWAPLETERIERVGHEQVTILALHNISLSDRELVRRLRARGWKCVAAERSFGSYSATFSREMEVDVVAEPPSCPESRVRGASR